MPNQIEKLKEEIEELKHEIELRDEKINELKEYIEEYTNPKSTYELYGISDKDFL